MGKRTKGIEDVGGLVIQGINYLVQTLELNEARRVLLDPNEWRQRQSLNSL